MNMIHSEPAAGTNRHFSHSLPITGDGMAVWTLWTDVARWRLWDGGLKDARIDGAYAVGAVGWVTPHSGPDSRFEVTDVEPHRRTRFVTRLILAALDIDRSIDEIASGTPGQRQITHDVRFTGPLGWLFAAILGPGFRRALPSTMAKLVELADADAAAVAASGAGR
jgi:Polyketide cyclase / dehydrase and lipid transport